MSNEFEILYNALSVGWHLRKIKEVAPELLENEEDFNRFIGWLERHKCKPHGGNKDTRKSNS